MSNGRKCSSQKHADFSDRVAVYDVWGGFPFGCVLHRWAPESCTILSLWTVDYGPSTGNTAAFKSRSFQTGATVKNKALLINGGTICSFQLRGLLSRLPFPASDSSQLLR